MAERKQEEEAPVAARQSRGLVRPGLGNAYELALGGSNLVTNPLAIFLEWLYGQYRRLRDRVKALCAVFFPRRPERVGTVFDGSVGGRLTFAAPADCATPIHHMRVELWARTWLFQYIKLGDGYTDRDGRYDIPFDMSVVHRWRVRRVDLEVHQTTHRFADGKLEAVHTPFATYGIRKRDLVGLEYSPGTTQLFLWEYRDDTPLARVVIKDHGRDAPQQYSTGRVDAIVEKLIPVEITKLAHLERIRLGDPGLTLARIQADYPDNLTVREEREHPGRTRDDAWFGDRFMNGMYAAAFEADAERAGRHWVRYRWRDYPLNAGHALPDVDMQFALRPDGAPLPVEILLTGQLNAHERDRDRRHSFSPNDGERWQEAKRVARVTAALTTEIDTHLVGAHLNVEQWAIAAYRNLRRSPLSWLLLPHLREVVLINHTADGVLIGPDGYIPHATALTSDAIVARAVEVLGALDWRGWAPPQPVSDAHRYARALNLLWEVLTEYVDDFFDRFDAQIREHWYEVYRFSGDLVTHSVPRAGATGGGGAVPPRAISAITGSEQLGPDNAGDLANLKQACRYIIIRATLMHSWVSNKQYDDVGELLYNCLGLRFGDGPAGVMAPESDLRIAPDRTESTQMLWIAYLLSNTQYGFIVANEEQDISPTLIDMLKRRRRDFDALGVRIEEIQSRTNS